MKFGMPTLVEFNSIEENMKLCKSLDLDFVELNMNLPQFNTSMDINEINTLKRKYDLEVTMHLHEKIDIGEFDDILRNGYHDTVLKSIEIAKNLDVNLINMHLSVGIHFKMPNYKVNLYDSFEEEYLTNIIKFRDKVENAIGNDNLVISIENTGIHNHEFIVKCTDLLLESKSFVLTYDIGHDITSGFNDRLYYKKNENRIKHFHIHDGTSKKNHLELFTGDLDILKFIGLAEYNNARCVIEVKESDSLIKSILNLNLRLNPSDDFKEK